MKEMQGLISYAIFSNIIRSWKVLILFLRWLCGWSIRFLEVYCHCTLHYSENKICRKKAHTLFKCFWNKDLTVWSVQIFLTIHTAPIASKSKEITVCSDSCCYLHPKVYLLMPRIIHHILLSFWHRMWKLSCTCDFTSGTNYHLMSCVGIILAFFARSEIVSKRLKLIALRNSLRTNTCVCNWRQGHLESVALNNHQLCFILWGKINTFTLK